MSRKVGIIILTITLVIFIGQIVIVDLLDIDMGILSSILRYWSTVAIIAGVFVAILSGKETVNKKDDSENK